MSGYDPDLLGYELLTPTIGIHIVGREIFRDRPGHLHSFAMIEEEHGWPLSDLFRVVAIELPKFRLRADQLATDLDRWCYLLLHATELDGAALPSAFATPTMTEAVRVLTVLQQTPQERMAYEDRLRRQRDHDSAFYWARREGLETGRQEGERVGVGKGERQALRKALGEILEARFGAEGRALAEGLNPDTDAERLSALLRAASLGTTLEDLQRRV